MKKKKILYLVNHLAYFASHRIDLAISAKKFFDIKILCGSYGSKNMEDKGIKVVNKEKIFFKRFKILPGSFNIIKEFNEIKKIFFLIKKIKPDIIHTISPKFNLIGGLISILVLDSKLVMSLSGFGYIYNYNIILKNIYIFLLKLIIHKKKPFIIVHNKNTKKFIHERFDIPNKKIIITFGSGVNLKKFKQQSYSFALKKILFPARVLKDKGIVELLNVAKIFQKRFKDWSFIIAGTLDYKSPNNAKNFIKNFKYKKNVKFLGHVNNIKKYYKTSSIICLPSYHEGMPKSLLEAFAVGRAVVATSIPGCTDIIKNNVNGFLCKPKNAESLFLSLQKLVLNKNLMIKFGKNNSKKAKIYFSDKNVIKKIIKCYFSSL